MFRARRETKQEPEQREFVHFMQITRKRHLVQLASAKNARRRQNLENAPEAHAHEYMVSRAPPNSKRTQLFASAEGASEKNFGKIKYFHSKKRPKSGTKWVR